MAREIQVGRTSAAEYIPKGAWVHRHATSGMVQRYDTLPGFVQELMDGCLAQAGGRRPKAPASSIDSSTDQPGAGGARDTPRLRQTTEFHPMRTVQNTPSYHGQEALAILAGWQPQHRSLEAEAAELLDLSKRDNAAHVTFARRSAR
jgi:hypothetical protein